MINTTAPTRTPFQPVGDLPKWRMVYDGLAQDDPQIGDVVTYERLSELLGHDIRNDRGPWTKAANMWAAEHHRAFAPVRNVGYRVVSAPEHEMLARGHHKKSKRSLERGRRAIQNADRSLLTPEDRERFDQMEQTIRRHQDLIRRLDLRQGRMEQTLTQAKSEVTQTTARVDALEAALRRHGIDVAEAGG